MPLNKKYKPSSSKLNIIKDNAVIATSPQYLKEINLKIATYFYATNTPFSHADSSHFHKMCNTLRPGCKPPTSRKIAGELLDEVHQTVLEETKEILKGTNLSMSLDGWSNVHNEPIICCSVMTAYGDSFLIKTVDTSGHPHTADYLKDIAIEAITETEKLFDAKVTSLVTDNAANVSKMRRLLEIVPGINIIQYGCSAHILHLLACDIQIPGLMEHVIKVIKYFRYTHLPAAWYKAANGKRLVIPQDVRWNTATDAIECYLENRGILVQVCQDNKESVDSNIYRIVNDINITNNARDFLLRMKPIAVALDRMQRDGSTIAVAVEIWRKLGGDLKGQPENVLKQFKKRKEMALTPAHYLAHLLDHRFRGHQINAEKQLAFEYLQNINDEFIPIVMALSTGSKPFPSYMFGNNFKTTPPMTWWKSVSLIEPEKYFDWAKLQGGFLDMCSKHLIAVSASAGLERIFSTFGFVHSKLRNKLGNEKAGKLTFLFRHFNQNTKDKAVNLDFVWEAETTKASASGSDATLSIVSAVSDTDSEAEDDVPLATLLH